MRRTAVVCGTMYKNAFQEHVSTDALMHSKCLIKCLPSFVVEFRWELVSHILEQLEDLPSLQRRSLLTHSRPNGSKDLPLVLKLLDMISHPVGELTA